MASTGSLFETFDFYLFSLFALGIGSSLFGHSDVNSNLTWVFMAFGSGFVARIFGALIFGYIGDKFGRGEAFKYTITVIALSSIFIGLIPTFDTIG
jgi:MHS family proline/betaine transporter-like MFS transporter